MNGVINRFETTILSLLFCRADRCFHGNNNSLLSRFAKYCDYFTTTALVLMTAAVSYKQDILTGLSQQIASTTTYEYILPKKVYSVSKCFVKDPKFLNYQTIKTEKTGLP